jgi:hypothetical protein
LIDFLRPVVQAVHAFSSILGEAASLVSPAHSESILLIGSISLHLPTGSISTDKGDIHRN